MRGVGAEPRHHSGSQALSEVAEPESGEGQWPEVECGAGDTRLGFEVLVIDDSGGGGVEGAGAEFALELAAQAVQSFPRGT